MNPEYAVCLTVQSMHAGTVIGSAVNVYLISLKLIYAIWNANVLDFFCTAVANLPVVLWIISFQQHVPILSVFGTVF